MAALLLSFASATCMSAFGETACGYDCVAAFGEVQCAERPLGRCESAFGEVVCADPPRWLLLEYGMSLPRVECMSAFGETACGYECTSGFGEVRCAETPWGQCVVTMGEVRCWDPAPPMRQAPRQPPRRGRWHWHRFDWRR